MSTATAAADQLHQSPSFDGRPQAASQGFLLPAFVETKRLCKMAFAEMGVNCSSRRAHRIAEVLFAIWSGDEVPGLHSDPTATEAIKRVMAKLAAA